MGAPKTPNTSAATAALIRKAQERKAADLHAAGLLQAVTCFGWARSWSDTPEAARPLFVAQAAIQADAMGLVLASVTPSERFDVETESWVLSWPLLPKPSLWKGKEWTPGRGAERIREEAPHLIPSRPLTEEEKRRVDEIAAAGQRAAGRAAERRADS